MKNPNQGKDMYVLFRNRILICCFLVLATSWHARSSPVVNFTLHPSGQTVCQDGNTTFTVAATGSGPLTYQWEISTNGGASWSNVVESGLYSGSLTSVLSITGATTTMNTYRYRCRVSDGTPATSLDAILTVNPAPTVQTGNVGVSICANGGGTLTAMLFPNLSYQWQVSANLGASWTNVTDGGSYAGSATDALVINNAASLDGYLYRYIATNNITGCSATSTGVDTLHVNYITSSSAPPATTLTCPASSNTLTLAASGNGTLAYQWRYNPSGINVVDNANYSGSTTNALTISNLATSLTRYTVTVTNNGVCPVVFGPYTYQVRTATAINTQPQNSNICATGNASFTAAVAGSGLALRWQESTNGGVSWANVNNGGIYGGATTATLNLTGVPVSMNSYRYRITVNGSCGNIISNEVILTVRSSGTWLGAVDTNWHVAGNWCGGVPVSTTDVLIPDWAPRMPTISNATGTAFFQSLAIEGNAKLTISGGAVDVAAYAGTFNIAGTVAYISIFDQIIFPANHGSLEIGGNGHKDIYTDVAIAHNLVLGGAAKLITSNNILTMSAGSNPITGPSFSGTVTSWIVTGDGSSGASNTGLGGLRIEQIANGDGPVLYPIGPTFTAYNPALVTNTGVTDNFTLAVNDQRIAGVVYQSGIYRTWLLSEALPGGSNIALDLRWQQGEEQTSFRRNITEVIRSNGVSIVQTSSVAPADGSDPFNRAAGSFTTLTQFSVASDVWVLPENLLSFNARRISGSSAQLNWQTDKVSSFDSYSIQRSTDDQSFEDIGTVQSEYGKSDFQFTDVHLGNRSAAYRLKMNGPGSNAGYSAVVVVSNEVITGPLQVQLRPSLVTNGITSLYIRSATKENITLAITDVSGRVQGKQLIVAETGTSIVPVNIKNLSKGVYYLQIVNNGFRKTLPLIIK